ncbi:hypothetical protein H4R20_004377 [Coemansia guatemalensis]|uniref:Zn(2)-C6 fungal-type domain-containing protein n=1 Tax=Coemansia guatemalensis TaxID=2761395 RepID=A0A9W8I008_9FUNG|nr:hypothetical protein H4R20_004377 [Coemansia guatemalensis]
MFNIPYLTSCNHCREKKRKCNQERPACSLCRAHNVPCEYRRSRRFRKRAQDIASASPHSGMSVHNVMLVPEQRSNGQQQQQQRNGVGTPGSHTQMRPLLAPYPVNGSHGPASAPAASGNVFTGPYSHAAGVTIQQQQQQQQQQQLPDALPNEVNALTRLLAGDLYPQQQQLPQPILQGVNTFMSPFSDVRSHTIPEWISQQKPEAAILSNLENIANAYQPSPLVPLQTTMTPDGAMFSNLTSQLMQGGSLFQAHPFNAGGQQQVPPPPLQLSQTGVSQAASGALDIPSILTPPVTAGIPGASSAGYNGLAFAQQPTFANNAGLSPIAKRASSLAGSNPDGEASWASSPVSGQSIRASSYEERSTSAGAKSGNSTPMLSMFSTLASSDKQGCLRDSVDAASANRSSHPPRINGAEQKQNRGRPKAPVVHYPDDYVPEVIKVYAREFPADLSPEVLLKVMRGICGSTRTSLINVDLELSWCMILKGIIPRILLFAYIASMARGQAIDPELMPLLPAKFDELCYDVAVKDIGLAAASPCLWSALSLHLIGRYEFQSARYDLMMEHYEMASEILSKTTFHGCAFPWKDVPKELKHTFEYDYYVYTFWVGFQWHLVSSFNLDRPFNAVMDPHSLPIPTSTRGYFAPDLPCEFDLLTLLPADSWPQSAQTKDMTQVWFRGFDDPEYEGWRPTAWKDIRPNYKITMYLQRMMPIGAQLYCLQRSFSDGKLELGDYLRQLHTHQELLKRWLYSLPEEFEITLAKVAQFARSDSDQQMPGENKNLHMDFKELIMTYGLYSTFVIRANRVALLRMLNENISTPATSMGMRLFGLRDYFEALSQGEAECDFGRDECSLWQKNLDFHKCRMQCYESMDILCDVVQLSFILRLDLFTYGTTYVTIAGEMLNVLISQLGVDDRRVKWRTKTRLGHVLCLLRSLQHWAPAIYMFAYGIQALSDPSLVLDVDNADTSVGTASMEKQASGHTASSSESDQAPLAAQIGLAQQNGQSQESSAGSKIVNPFPPNHIINLIVADLDVSLAAFLAPAYPMLLLKLFASKM